MPRTHLVRGALLVAALGAGAGCSSDKTIIAPNVVDPIFTSFVALGNSITAGFQSDGINDSTQKQSYALLLAKQMGTRYAFPSLANPGCPPPINNVLTGTRVTLPGSPPSTSTTCALRNTAVPVPSTLNNVAVPGFASADPTALGAAAPSANPLAQLILGGKTMVRKAIDVSPTFATVWIGNNDVLGPALNGLPSTATPLSTLAANYATMMNELTAGAPDVKGVLIGVGQAAVLPIMFQAGALASPAAAAAASQIAGRPVVLDPVTCSGNGAASLVNLEYLVAIRSRPAAQPGIVFCKPIAGGGPSDPGDAGILDVVEQATVSALIVSYNVYIKAKADSIGFAFFDPNPLFASLRASGAIPAFPNLASTTATFGQYISLDGVHPSALAHIALANEIIAVINGKYGTHLAAIP